MVGDSLSLFHPAVSRWFRESFACPTPAQAEGWPRIAAGENTLILAPTGSGKTLAAFLYAINELLTRPVEEWDAPDGVHTLYVSPLRALATDIERNLEPALDGARACAEKMKMELPQITVAVRTGDTPSAERQRMVRRPPHLLITTPESLHLLLTSPRAREMLRTVRFIIVDEIHSLCTNKRGTFLALLLERLEALVPTSLIRVGLSGTQRPLDRIGRFLVGYRLDGTPRPVSIVDAGMRKSLDLEVLVPVDDMSALPRSEGTGPSIWPAVFERLLELVEEHTSTLIFANNRRTVERIAARMNELAGHPLVRAHHGSVSKLQRQRIELELKAGTRPALVATSSLELGIDIGAIDLVCQVETPYSVASALQRVGRAGHLVRATSKGRMLPKARDDLLRMAGVVRAMRRGDISAVHIPRNALDVLAQQVVAMVAMDSWTVDKLYERIRCASPYHELPREAYLSVLELVSGRYWAAMVSALRPRIAWDRASDTLHALPGSRHVAVLNGGVIPDTAEYPVVLEDGTTRLGELDEEFVFERREGDTILLGTGRWKILEIRHDRVIVAPSDELEAQTPFWRAEGLGHDAEFGQLLGAFVRECESRLENPDFEAWLRSECELGDSAAHNLAVYLRSQLDDGGTLPSDRTIVLDAFLDESGDPRLAVLTPFGRAFHLALLLAVQAELRRRGHDPPRAVFSNVGILFRPGAVPVEALVRTICSLRAEDAERRIVEELEKTPFFALRFRRNAARALLLPRARPGRRTPLWVQRLRAHDLLRHASRHPSFPIVAETYREILEDVLPLASFRGFLGEVRDGGARFAVRRSRRPSAFSASLLLDFTAKYLYGEDEPAPPKRSGSFDREGRVVLVGANGVGAELLDPDAFVAVEERLQGMASFHRARDGVELVELLRRVGSLTEDELLLRCEPAALDALPHLVADGRVVRVTVNEAEASERLAAAEDTERFTRMSDEDVRDLVARFVSTHAAASRDQIVARYPQAAGLIERLLEGKDWVEVTRPDGEIGIADPEVVSGIRRSSLARRRRRVRMASPSALSAYVIAHQHHSETSRGENGLRETLEQLAGWFLPVGLWPEVLAARGADVRYAALDQLVGSGAFTWVGRTTAGSVRTLAFVPGDLAGLLLPSQPPPQEDAFAVRILTCLTERGALFTHQIANETEVPPSSVARLLWRLIWSGHVTNDSLRPAWSGGPRRDRWEGRRPREPWGAGRWSLVPRLLKERSDEEIRIGLRFLLNRCGILSREMIQREGLGIRWSEAYPILSRMEWRGEVERGLFVSGLSGPQFATTDASVGIHRSPEDRGTVLLNVNDPANLYGAPFPVIRSNNQRYSVRHHPGNYLIVRAGRPILAIEKYGARLIPLAEIEPAERSEAVGLLPLLLERSIRRTAIRIFTWDGQPVTSSLVALDLRELGFMEEDERMILYRDFHLLEDG